MAKTSEPPQIFAETVRPAMSLIAQHGMTEFLAQFAGFLRVMIEDYHPLLWEKALENISTFPPGQPDPEPALTAAFIAYLQQERDSAILAALTPEP